MPDEYYEPDSGIEVNGGGEGVFINFFFKRNVSNVSSFFFVELPDEYYELNSGIDQPVELVVNNRTLARGEIVIVDGFYGIRISEITSAGERFKSLNS